MARTIVMEYSLKGLDKAYLYLEALEKMEEMGETDDKIEDTEFSFVVSGKEVFKGDMFYSKVWLVSEAFRLMGKYKHHAE